jgi:hypothetical protein
MMVAILMLNIIWDTLQYRSQEGTIREGKEEEIRQGKRKMICSGRKLVVV